MKVYLYGPYGRSIFCYRPYFCIFLCDQLLRYRHDLEYDSLSMFMYDFTSMGDFLVVDRVYRSRGCPLARVVSLNILSHFSYDRFDVVEI